MKFSKLVRFSALFTVFSVAALSVYSNFKAIEAYDRMRSSSNDLKKRLSDVRAAANILSKQMRSQSEKMDGMIETLGELLYSDRYINTTDESENEKMPYTLKEYDGIIGIYNDEDELVDEDNVLISSLSASDRTDLEIGIKVQGDRELEKVLEDIKRGER